MTRNDWLAAYDRVCEIENTIDELQAIVGAGMTGPLNISSLNDLYRRTAAMRLDAWRAAHNPAMWES